MEGRREKQRSTKKTHARDGCRSLIKRDHKFAFCGVSAPLDQVIGEVGASGSEGPRRLRDDIRTLDNHLLAA
ncbi:MAG: hypothetical protein JWQ87_4028 [Candidatus Sulfotelmatobacter sp.]|nr:hypothetical protein [Candidatus Sulfotelmatobacter sp.]